MKSSTLRIAVLALFLLGAALGFSYTVASNMAQAAACNCTFTCGAYCTQGGLLNPQEECEAIAHPCSICKCY